jgi:hypothetical protein
MPTGIGAVRALALALCECEKNRHQSEYSVCLDWRSAAAMMDLGYVLPRHVSHAPPPERRDDDILHQSAILPSGPGFALGLDVFLEELGSQLGYYQRLLPRTALGGRIAPSCDSAQEPLRLRSRRLWCPRRAVTAN